MNKYQIEDIINGLKICGILILLIIAFLGFMFFVTYMDEKDKPTIPIESETIIIDQVMEHKYGCYSIKYKQDDGELIEIYLGNSARLFVDVEENQPIWAQIERAKSENGDTFRVSSIIHIRSAKDINGGGWQHIQNKRHIEEQTNVIDSQ